jgi:hypothetical protein
MKKISIIVIAFISIFIIAIFIVLEIENSNIENEEEDINDPFKNLEGDPDVSEDPDAPSTSNPSSSSSSSASSGTSSSSTSTQNPNSLTLEEITLINIAECQLIQGLIYYVSSNGLVSCALPNTPEGNYYSNLGYQILISLEIKQIVTCLNNGLNANITINNILCE